MAKNVQGAALTGLRRYSEAEKLLLASLPALAGSPIADLPQRGRARLAELYTAWGKPEEAAKYATLAGPTASHNTVRYGGVPRVHTRIVMSYAVAEHV